jgi:hypothetical protein
VAAIGAAGPVAAIGTAATVAATGTAAQVATIGTAVVCCCCFLKLKHCRMDGDEKERKATLHRAFSEVHKGENIICVSRSYFCLDDF